MSRRAITRRDIAAIVAPEDPISFLDETAAPIAAPHL